MSAVSVTSNKREGGTHELQQELEAVRAMNTALRHTLERLRAYKENLIKLNKNCKQLSKVNTEWIKMVKECDK